MSIRSAARAAAESVLVRLPRRTQPGDRLILAYHNVVPAGSPPRGDRSLHLPIDRFEAQLRLIRHEAEIVPLMELLTTDAPNDRRVAITFDDAYASALRLGVGACVAADAPCTVFVAPGILGAVPYWDRAADAGRWSDAEREAFLWTRRGIDHEATQSIEVPNHPCRLASRGELAEVAEQPGVTIGCHTGDHPNLAALDAAEASEQVRAGGTWIASAFPERAIPALAYPFGLAPRDPHALLASTGLRFGLFVTGGWHGGHTPLDAARVPRLNVPAALSINGFAIRLRGML